MISIVGRINVTKVKLCNGFVRYVCIYYLHLASRFDEKFHTELYLLPILGGTIFIYNVSIHSI